MTDGQRVSREGPQQKEERYNSASSQRILMPFSLTPPRHGRDRSREREPAGRRDHPSSHPSPHRSSEGKEALFFVDNWLRHFESPRKASKLWHAYSSATVLSHHADSCISRDAEWCWRPARRHQSPCRGRARWEVKDRVFILRSRARVRAKAARGTPAASTAPKAPSAPPTASRLGAWAHRRPLHPAPRCSPCCRGKRAGSVPRWRNRHDKLYGRVPERAQELRRVLQRQPDGSVLSLSHAEHRL